MHTLNIILFSVNLAFCIANLIIQEDKRGAYFMATLGWFAALLGIIL